MSKKWSAIGGGGPETITINGEDLADLLENADDINEAEIGETLFTERQQIGSVSGDESQTVDVSSYSRVWFTIDGAGGGDGYSNLDGSTAGGGGGGGAGSVIEDGNGNDIIRASGGGGGGGGGAYPGNDYDGGTGGSGGGADGYINTENMDTFQIYSGDEGYGDYYVDRETGGAGGSGYLAGDDGEDTENDDGGDGGAGGGSTASTGGWGGSSASDGDDGGDGSIRESSDEVLITSERRNNGSDGSVLVEAWTLVDNRDG